MSSKRRIYIEVPIDNSKQPEDETKAEETEASNGKPNNKIMKLSEMTNMDPLEYFTRFLDIPELIFHHLTGKEVLAASEVYPSWYNFIASSKVLMQKIKVVLDRDFDCNGEDFVGVFRVRTKSTRRNYHYFSTSSTDLMKIKVVFNDKSANQSEDFDLLKNSPRLYQNIEVRRSAKVLLNQNQDLSRRVGDYVTNSELDFMLSKAHEWKNVSLENVYFRKKLDLWRLLSAIESSVESIAFEHFGVLSFEDPYSEIESLEALKFSKLKKLTVDFEHANDSLGETFARFLLNSVAIEEFQLTDWSGSGEIRKDILTKMLQNFNSLTKVSIHSPVRNQIFEDESWKKFHFELKHLSMIEPTTNFRSFLKSQSGHLEKLWIAKAENRETFDMVMEMPKLKELTLTFFKAFPENEVPNKTSNSITELKLHSYTNADSLKYLLDSMPKVRNLSLWSIDEEGFKMLKSIKKKFEKLNIYKAKGVDRKEMEEIMTENYISLETDDIYSYVTIN